MGEEGEEYDEDLEIAVPLRAEVQQVASPKFSAPSMLPAPLQTVFGLASRIISWRGWLVGGGFVGDMMLYSLQWQKQSCTLIAMPTAVRSRDHRGFSISGYDRSGSDVIPYIQEYGLGYLVA